MSMYAKVGAWNSTRQAEVQMTRKHVENIMEHWSEQWQKYPHCQQTKNFYPVLDKKLYKKTQETFQGIYSSASTNSHRAE